MACFGVSEPLYSFTRNRIAYFGISESNNNAIILIIEQKTITIFTNRGSESPVLAFQNLYSIAQGTEYPILTF